MAYRPSKDPHMKTRITVTGALLGAALAFGIAAACTGGPAAHPVTPTTSTTQHGGK